MSVKKQREILDAYDKGEGIERKSEYYNVPNWTTIESKLHPFDFNHYSYRIKKRLKRWRAKKGEKYYIIGIRGDIVEYTECAEPEVDDLLFAFGNYFQTREKAEKARDLLEETLTKFHEVND